MSGTLENQKYNRFACPMVISFPEIASVRCPYCHSDQIVKRGKTRRGTQRYLRQNTACIPQSFLLEYRYLGR